MRALAAPPPKSGGGDTRPSPTNLGTSPTFAYQHRQLHLLLHYAPSRRTTASHLAPAYTHAFTTLSLTSFGKPGGVCYSAERPDAPFHSWTSGSVAAPCAGRCTVACLPPTFPAFQPHCRATACSTHHFLAERAGQLTMGAKHEQPRALSGGRLLLLPHRFAWDMTPAALPRVPGVIPLSLQHMVCTARLMPWQHGTACIRMPCGHSVEDTRARARHRGRRPLYWRIHCTLP